MDELTARVRLLEAERLRPVPPRRRKPDGGSALMALLMELPNVIDEDEQGDVRGEDPHDQAGVLD